MEGQRSTLPWTEITVYLLQVAQIHIVTCQAHPVLVKKANQMCGSFLLKNFMDPWPRVLSLPGRFVVRPRPTDLFPTLFI